MSGPDSGKLRRNLGAAQIQLISLGGIIGSAYFLGIGSSIAELGPSIVPAFLIGGIIVWFVALAMGELCGEYPVEGGFVSFARELVGAPWAAGVGWSYWLNWCAYIGSEMIAGGIIMHQFVPMVPVIIWAMAFGALITVINLLNVKHFGTIESVLALIKIAAIAAFTFLGVMIWTGLAGSEGFLGTTHLTRGSGISGAFPAGPLAILFSMIMVLVNFQGTELIALSAAETENPRENVARATRKVALRIVAIYLLPLLVLVSILPFSESSLKESVFATALSRHGFGWAAALFSFVALSAAFSCANSGLYGSVRALYGLGKEGLAPKFLTHLNRAGVPSNATWVTIAACWAFLPLFLFFEGTSFYTWLLSVSGFTGAICWISISWCHLRYRLARHRRVPAWSYASIALQIACLALIPLEPTLRGCLVIGVPAVAVPYLVVWWLAHRKQPTSRPELSGLRGNQGLG